MFSNMGGENSAWKDRWVFLLVERSQNGRRKSKFATVALTGAEFSKSDGNDSSRSKLLLIYWFTRKVLGNVNISCIRYYQVKELFIGTEEMWRNSIRPMFDFFPSRVIQGELDILLPAWKLRHIHKNGM